MQPLHPTTLLVSLALAAPVAAQSADPLGESRARLSFSSVRDALTEPVVDRNEDELFVRMRDQRATFDADSMTILPIFGKASPREWPVDVSVAGASVGGTPIDVTPTAAASGDSQRVTVARAAMRGEHHLSLDGLEQTFVFDTLPTRGELVVELSVDTDLAPYVDGDTLRFVADGLGHVDVGLAFAFDASGRSQRIERTWNGHGIDLRVPADFVASAELPLTIDPVWSTFVHNGSPDDDAHPDVAFCGTTQEYLLVWEDWVSQTNSDVYAVKLDTDLVPSSSVLIVDSSSDSWTDPAVAYVRPSDEAVVVAVVENGTTSGQVRACPIDVGNWQRGTSLTVSTTGSTTKVSPDVGGTSTPSPNVIPRFCAVWSREVTPGNFDVEYRVMRTDGTVESSILAIDGNQADEIQPSISTGLGRTSLPGIHWNLAWTRDDDNDGLGQIRGRRIAQNGNPVDGIGQFLITTLDDCAFPSISSTFDDAYQGDRPVVCVYERHLSDLTRPNGLQSDIHMAILLDGITQGGSSLTEQEDGPRALLQVRPSIAINGTAFMVTYVEEEPTALNQGRWNAYMCTGEIRPTSIMMTPTLAERHVELGATSDLVSPVAIATRWSGDVHTNSNEGLAVWSRFNGHQSIEHGRIEGAGVDYLIPSFFTAHAVGEQYGEANENSTGVKGWLRILGDQVPTNPHLAQAIDLPQNAFGYLIVGTSPTNVNMPGGSQGKLLVGGGVGRYVNSIQSSGQLGRIDVAIDPTSIPQANGAVAAVAGNNFYFQMWHRDSSFGQPTSNFTNACKLHFE